MKSQLDLFQTLQGKIAYAYHLEDLLNEAHKINENLRSKLLEARGLINSLDRELYLTRDERSRSYAQRLKKENYKLRQSLKRAEERYRKVFQLLIKKNKELSIFKSY